MAASSFKIFLRPLRFDIKVYFFAQEGRDSCGKTDFKKNCINSRNLFGSIFLKYLIFYRNLFLNNKKVSERRKLYWQIYIQFNSCFPTPFVS
jgi:hypothetical protein